MVNFGRLGDMFGRVRIYNAGFAVFTVASVLLSVRSLRRQAGPRMWLIGWRVLQALGGSMLAGQLDGHPDRCLSRRPAGLRARHKPGGRPRRQFIGLVAGGLLAALDWRAVFWVNVPVGIFGTLWAYPEAPRDGGKRRRSDRLVGQRHLRRRPSARS